MDERILKQAQERAHARATSRQQDLDERAALPKPKTVADIARERLSEKDLEKIAPSSGYPELDNIIRGFIPGHLYTLTGNENVGKTSLACNFAVRVARQNKKVLYVALEPDNMVVDYIASVRTNKRFQDVLPDELSFDDQNIHIYGKDAVPNLDALVKIIEMSERYDLVIIDHVGYFLSANSNWVQDQSNAIKRLAGLCKKQKTAIMMIAHLRKRNQSQKKTYVPTSDDIAGSGAFKQDSTEVMIVVRNLDNPDEGGLVYTGLGTLYVTKTKAGPNGQMQLIFTDQCANITSPAEMAAKEGYSLVGQNGIQHDTTTKPETEQEDFKW